MEQYMGYGFHDGSRSGFEEGLSRIPEGIRLHLEAEFEPRIEEGMSLSHLPFWWICMDMYGILIPDHK